MGVPVYWCSDELFQSWMLPLRAALLDVRPTQNSLVWTIHSGNDIEQIEFDRDATSEWTVPNGYIFGLVGRSKLAQTVERILLASGARAIGGTDSSRWLFRCGVEVINDWPSLLNQSTTPRLFLKLVQTHSQYPAFVVKSKTTSVYVCSGFGLETEAGKVSPFLSISLNTSIYREANRVEAELAADIISCVGSDRLSEIAFVINT